MGGNVKGGASKATRSSGRDVRVGPPALTRRGLAHRELREEVDRRILDAAAGLLGEGATLTELGVERIAAAAGVSRSTFYVHFRDKTDLLVRLADRATAELFATADRFWTEDHGGGPEQLSAVILAMVRIYRRHEPVLRAVVEVAGYDAEVAAFWRERMDRYADFMRERIEADRRAGLVAASLDARHTAFAIVWGVERGVSEHVRAAAPAEDGAFARALGRAAWLAVFGETPGG
jgi:TetR/AcrR family transcriptional regulator, ethionamide resistance regulator